MSRLAWTAQQWGEVVQGAPDELAYLVKDSLCVFPFAESYIEGDLGLDVYVWIWASRGDENPQHHVARLRAVLSVDQVRLKDPLVTDDLVGDLAIDHDLSVGRQVGLDVRIDQERRPNGPVLVVVRQVSDGSEKRELVPGSVISLKAFRYLGGLRADVFEKAMRVEGDRVSAGEDRELDRRRFLVGGFSPQVLDSKLPPKVIKSTAKVVDGVSEDEAPVFSNLGHLLGDEQNPLTVRIELPSRAENAGRLSIACSHHGPPKLVHVGVCVVKLGPATS